MYMAKTNLCIDCGMSCDKRCQRCQPCSNKLNGRSRIWHTNHCKECGSEITKSKYILCLSCNMKKRWSNDEYKNKTRATIKASFDARWSDPNIRKKMIKILTTFSGVSKLETKVAKIAIKYGYQPSIVVGRYLADMLNETKKIIVEVNGDYWHCNPKFWKPDDIHAFKKMTAQEIWETDFKRKTYLESLGYSVNVIWEQDIIKGKDKFITDFFEQIIK